MTTYRLYLGSPAAAAAGEPVGEHVRILQAVTRASIWTLALLRLTGIR